MAKVGLPFGLGVDLVVMRGAPLIVGGQVRVVARHLVVRAPSVSGGSGRLERRITPVSRWSSPRPRRSGPRPIGRGPLAPDAVGQAATSFAVGRTKAPVPGALGDDTQAGLLSSGQHVGHLSR